MGRMTSETRASLTAFKAVKVKHPRLEEVDLAVTRAIAEHASYAHLMLYGPSGVGKSTVTKRITERFLEEEPNRAIVPVVLVEARSSDIGAYARLDYYRQVLSQLRNHVAVRDHLMNLALSAKPTRAVRDAAEWLDMREAVEYALERLQVKAVVIDEAQHLMRVEAPQKPVDQLDWLKSITNRTNVLHVLVGNYDQYDFRNLSGQAARRGRDVYFPRYHLQTKAECEEFAGALRYLLERVPLICDVEGLLSQWRWFAEWSIGCIGILRDWVVDTVAALCEEGGTTFTIEALKRFALQIDQRVRLEMEARAGEHKVEAGKARSHQQLEELLRKATATTASETRDASLTEQSHTPKTVTVAKKPPTNRVGERAPRRDPVGQVRTEDDALKCSFSGVTGIPPDRLAQTGVHSVGCPECGAMRTLQSHKNTVTFPSHQRCLTPPSSSDVRWLRSGTIWELSDSKT